LEIPHIKDPSVNKHIIIFFSFIKLISKKLIICLHFTFIYVNYLLDMENLVSFAEPAAYAIVSQIRPRGGKNIDILRLGNKRDNDLLHGNEQKVIIPLLITGSDVSWLL